MNRRYVYPLRYRQISITPEVFLTNKKMLDTFHEFAIGDGWLP
jgi:hypothetical protein